MRKTVFKFAPYFTPVLLAFTMTGQISALIVLTIILLLFCFMERKEAGIAFALIMPFVLGTAFSVLRLGIPGSIFALFIAVPLLFNELIHIKKRPSAVIFLGFILLTTLFSLLYGGNSNSGNKKFIDMLITITIAIITFYPIAFSKNINFQKVAIVYLISGIFFIDICFDFYGYIRTFNLFDFESFRISAIYNKDLGLPYISYHGPGMIGCYSVAFYL